MNTSNQTTTNHEVIRLWTEDREGVPACVGGTGDADDTGILRIHFPGQGSGDVLNSVSWNEFFKKFEEAELALTCQIRTSDGSLSRFSKLINRN